MNNTLCSIGIFIDGGYYAKINEALKEQSSQNIVVGKLFDYLRSSIAQLAGIPEHDCVIAQSHYYRGRYRVQDANAKHLLYSERKFEDDLIENDVVFHYKHLREIRNGNETTIIEKGIDVWFALEAYQLSLLHNFDYVVLITGDADHEMLARKLRTLKRRVILLTWNLGAQSSTSRLLKEEVWHHIELREACATDSSLQSKLCRTISTQ
ncbi:MAG: NYN domain-containing protein [Bacteroidales bacterium]|nr:NYN domain-containing protein [Bacteroidales bacterium]